MENSQEIQEAQKRIITEMEAMVLDTFNRMKRACTEKCVTKNYDQTKLMKTEAVCMDRCVAKYMEIHDMIGKNVSKNKETYDILANSPFKKEDKTT